MISRCIDIKHPIPDMRFRIVIYSDGNRFTYYFDSWSDLSEFVTYSDIFSESSECILKETPDD